MFRRRQLKQEAIRLRGRIQENQARAAVCAAFLRARVLAMLGTPTAMSVAFCAGVLVDRLGFPVATIADRVRVLVHRLFRISRMAILLRQL
jgi:uncharacterized protein (DUF2062 family)